MTFDNINQNVFGFTALVVSLVALLTTVLQVLQQYFSSADGYRRCAPSVMGLWAQGTHRKLRLREFRIEVVFETPVIFVAKPSNMRGPIPGRTIHYIDGTETSYTNTRVLQPMAQKQEEMESTARVHTADDEKASWVTFLSALQLQEKLSREWDAEMRTLKPLRDGCTRPQDREYVLTVGLQGKTRSWEFIPSSITKPYAKSAICHLVEMMSMLGLYWKVFGQSIWNLRAEGNGFILTSTTVHGLGVMVAFASTDTPSFRANRVIPCVAIKQLAFGTVPNIFEDGSYLDREKETQSLELVFGSPEDVEITLESLGCQVETLKRYKKDRKQIFSGIFRVLDMIKQAHMNVVSFEIIDMLSKVFRIRGSNFRMLPNPTADSWLKNIGAKASWRITSIMEVFQKRLASFITTEGLPYENPLSKISTQWKRITELNCGDEAELGLEAREAIHDALDKQTTFLLSIRQVDVLNILVAHVAKVMEVLENPVSPLNIIVLANKEVAFMTYYFQEIRPAVVGNTGTKTEQDEKNLIWISLIFRMLCWMLLHDFLIRRIR